MHQNDSRFIRGALRRRRRRHCQQSWRGISNTTVATHIRVGYLKKIRIGSVSPDRYYSPTASEFHSFAFIGRSRHIFI
jgi:hypothetical protein